jgi:hypothetical protein
VLSLLLLLSDWGEMLLNVSRGVEGKFLFFPHEVIRTVMAHANNKQSFFIIIYLKKYFQIMLFRFSNFAFVEFRPYQA